MTPKPPHPNAGSSGVLRIVIQMLEEFPQGLTTGQILYHASSRGTLKTDLEEGPKAVYFRVKRAVDSLLKLGFVRPSGYLNVEGRPQKVYVVVPQAMDEALREVLRQAFTNIEDQIRNQFPLSDAAHLVAAFEGVLEEEAERLGLAVRKPEIGNKALAIRKAGPSGNGAPTA